MDRGIGSVVDSWLATTEKDSIPDFIKNVWLRGKS